MKTLSELPNIGKELEIRLHRVGVNTVEEFKSLGSCKTFQLLHAINPASCINTLYSLEGAIQEIRWHDLDPEKKQELKEFMQMLQK